jgi:hypothetical protein
MDRVRQSAMIIAMVGLWGCSKQPPPATNPQATVLLKDGTSFAGTVTKSSPSEITVQAATGESRTYPMDRVSSVQYGPPQTVAANLPPTAMPDNTPATPSVSPAPPAAPGAPGAIPSGSSPGPEQVITVRTVPAGTRLIVRNNEPIDSKTAVPGQTYSAVISRDVIDTEGRVAIPLGSNATLVVRSVSAQGKIEGQSELALDLDSVVIEGRRYRVETGDIVKKGTPGVGKNKRTAKFVGGATALGTLLGAIAGGGKGAAIGALSGAAAGTTTQAVIRGKGVRVPAETIMTFRLEAPLRIKAVE